MLRKPATLTYSAAGATDADWRAVDIVADGYGQRFTALGPDGIAVDAAVALPGRHNVANALLALASLVAVGVDAGGGGGRGGRRAAAYPGRLEKVTAPGPVTGIVDYAHKADAIVAVLAALRESLRVAGTGRLICVLGAGGDRDTGKRPVMGRAAAPAPTCCWSPTTTRAPSHPAAIRAQVLAGAGTVAGADVREIDGRRAAIDTAVGLARPGDVVALLGKGHETGQEVAGVVYPFDDRIELADALGARFGTGTTGGTR